MSYQTFVLRCELTTRAPIEDVCRLFEDPYKLAVLTPPWLNFRIVNREPVEMRKGAEINYRIRWLGLPLRWRTIITDYSPPHRFIDTQARGPYLLWHHTHTFRSTPAGTVVADEVVYSLPFGPLGLVAHRLLVRRQLLQIFRYRQRRIAELLGGVVETRLPTITREAMSGGDRWVHRRV